jgi:dTDP-4-amino-4,6-dideoxygalactose transaminase
MSYWKERIPPGQNAFPVADRYFAGAVTLPLFPGMSDAQVDRVVDTLRHLVR